jgi:ABC-type multidrug transport system fused ATPase/permease subunit
MKKIFKILNFSEKLKLLLIILLILITASLEIGILLFIQPLLLLFLKINDQYHTSSLLFNFNFTTKQLFLLFIIIFFLRNFFYVFTVLIKNFFIGRMHVNISKKIYSSYLNKNYDFFLKNNSSKLLSNILNQIENFSYRVFDFYLVFLTEIFLVLAIIFFLFYKFFLFSFILLIFCFLLFFVSTYFFKKKLSNLGVERVDLDKEKINNLQKSFYAIQSIKLDHIEDFFIKKFNLNNKNLVRIQAIYNSFGDLQKTLWEVVILISFSSAMYVGYNFFGLFRVDFVLIVGTFAFAFFRFLPSLNRLFNCLNSFNFYKPAIDFVYQELKDNNISANKIKEDTVNFRFSSEIRLNKISFWYDKKDLVILDEVDLTIKNNSITLIQGESGSGKSTLLNIICGLLHPTKGEVLVDNVNINSFLGSYQKKIGYVPQKTLLSDDSILENIVFGQHIEDLDMNLIHEVISKSKLTKLVERLPDGLNSIIGERGSSLSGGEQQRIGIARALYKKPEILILDEATSALDQNTERLLLKEILELKDTITIIMVSHKKLEMNQKVELFELKGNKIYYIKH